MRIKWWYMDETIPIILYVYLLFILGILFARIWIDLLVEIQDKLG